ncbi:MAG: hypothetical protein NTY64_04870 [Deltaproteobacteria bacterium]|nr:hypothetical protein [Deltaproteobacteria bacterium]
MRAWHLELFTKPSLWRLFTRSSKFHSFIFRQIKESNFSAKLDGFVKSPPAALRCILRRCGVPPSTPHSGGFARLAPGAFYFAIR